MKRDLYQSLLPVNCCSCSRALTADDLMEALSVTVDNRYPLWRCQRCWSPKRCFYCDREITKRDDLYCVSTYPHEFAPSVQGIEPGEYWACPKCYAKKDREAGARYRRYAKKYRQGPPTPILEIPVKLKAIMGKPVKR